MDETKSPTLTKHARCDWTVTDDADPNRLRTVTTTRLTSVSIIEAEPINLVVRVLRPEAGPCASIEYGCGVILDTAISPDGRYAYFTAGDDVVTGFEDGTARVLCSETHTSRVTIQRPGEPIEEYENRPTTQVFVEGGDFVVITRER